MAIRTRTARQLWLAVHLYLGLALGLLLSVTGVTGSLLVFYLELDHWLNPQLQITAQPLPRLSYDKVFQALRDAEPGRPGAWRIETPNDPATAITARYYKPEETQQRRFAPLLVSVDPYSGEVLTRRFWGQFAMTWLYELHYALLLDDSGLIVMAAVGGLLAVSVCTGLYLWWPPRHKWRSALTLKLSASRQRLVYDLHKVGGVYGSLVLLLLALTGIALEIPEYVNPLLNQVSPLRPMPKPLSNLPATPTPRISVDQAVDAALVLFPQAQLRWIETPQNARGCFRINLRQDGEPGRRFPKTNVWIDQYSGQVLAVNDPRQFSAGDTLLAWMHPLHSGEALDLGGRLLVLVSGLLCPLLFVTGLIRWLQKRRGQRAMADRARMR